jgi:hypothetical protein
VAGRRRSGGRPDFPTCVGRLGSFGARSRARPAPGLGFVRRPGLGSFGDAPGRPARVVVVRPRTPGSPTAPTTTTPPVRAAGPIPTPRRRREAARPGADPEHRGRRCKPFEDRSFPRSLGFVRRPSLGLLGDRLGFVRRPSVGFVRRPSLGSFGEGAGGRPAPGSSTAAGRKFTQTPPSADSPSSGVSTQGPHPAPWVQAGPFVRIAKDRGPAQGLTGSLRHAPGR